MGLGTKCLLVTFAAWVTFKFISDTEINYKDLLNNKNVVITGGSSGIGEEAAKYCAQMGANVVIVARRENLLQRVVTELYKLSPSSTAKIKYILADFSDPKISQAVINDAETFLGSIDYLLINHAFLPSTSDHISQWTGRDDQRNTLAYALNTNFVSYVMLADAAIPLLKKNNGSLLVVSSAIVDTPAFSLPYATSKGAINTFFTGLKQELVTTNTNISLTIVHLGFVETEASFKTLAYISNRMGKDLETVLSAFPTSSQKEAGKAIVDAMLRREYNFYHPAAQRLWLIRVARVILRDPDYWIEFMLDFILKIINWKKQYLW